MPRAVARLLVCSLLLAAGRAEAAELLLLDAGPALADGEGAVSLELRGPALQPGASLKIRSDQGKVSAIELGAGLARFQFLPDAQRSEAEALFEVRLKGPQGDLEETHRLALRAPGGPLALLASPPVAEAGQPVLLSLTAPPGRQAADQRQVWLSCNLGTVTAPKAAPGGAFTATWTPPKDLPNSALAVCGAADMADPQHLGAAVVVPVKVRRSITFQAPPESEVNLLIQGERFGPYKTSPAGSFAADLMLDPRAESATVEIRPRAGKPSTSEAPLPGAEGVHAFLPLPPTLVADPAQPFTLTLVAAERSAAPRTGVTPKIEASTGNLSAPRLIGPGRWAVDWTPPAAGSTVRFTANLDGRIVTVDRPLAPAPARLALAAAAPVTTKGKTTLAAELRQRNASGQALATPTPTLTTFGGARQGSPTGKSGQWKQAVAGADTVVVAEGAGRKPSGLPPASLVIDAVDPNPALRGGAPLRIVVLDALGLPVPKVPVTLQVKAGSGTLPPKVTTDAQGVATVLYKTGQPDEPARIEADAAGLRAAWVLQPGPAAGPLGDAAQQAARARAQSIGGLVFLDAPEPVAVIAARSPEAPVAAAPAVEAPPAERPSPTPATAPPDRLPGRVALHGYALSEDYAATGDAGAVTYAAGAAVGGDPAELIGASAQAVFWSTRVGLDLRASLAQRAVQPEGAAAFEDQPWSAAAALRLRKPLASTDAYALLGLGRQPFSLFLGDPEGPTEKALPGALVGAGLQGGSERLQADVSAEAFLGPYPVDLSLNGQIDLVLRAPLSLSLRVSAGQRKARFGIGEAEVLVEETRSAAGLGISYHY